MATGRFPSGERPRAGWAKAGRRGDGKTSGIAVSAAAPISLDGDIEALCAWYGPECVPAISEAWTKGDKRARSIFARVSSILVPAADIADGGNAERTFFNVNTPADLERARALAANDGAGQPS